MKRFLLLLIFLPGLLFGETKVLVNTIPAGATFAGASPFRLPFQDAGSQDPKSIANGLSSAIAGILPAATQQGFSYLCLFSSPGKNPIEIFIPAANTTLKLRPTKTSLAVVFFKGGEPTTSPVLFSTGAVDAQKPHVAVKFQKISVPPGVTTAGWIYFNLPRIQAEAAKAGSKMVMLQVEGTGAVTEVPIPGLIDPLLVPEGKTVLTASWYLDAGAETRLRKPAPATSPH